MDMAKPKIRFKGYTDDWEQRKLNEIADKVSEKNKNNEFSEPFTNSAEQGIISQKDYFDREIVNDENLNGYYIVRNDDFIYNPRISVTAPVGPINRNRLDRNGVISPLYTVFRTHDIDKLYLEFYFKTTKWHRFMKLNGDSGARFDRFTISSTQFMEMPIPYPTLEEQRKIGAYFESLATLITLHQCKCRVLPKLLYNDWEQRKLGEIFKEYSEKGHTELPTLTIIQGAGTVKREDSDRNLMYDEANLSNYKMVRKDDFIVHLRSFEGGLEKASLNGIISPAYHTFHSDEADSRFYYPYFRSFEFIKHKLVPHVYGIRDGRSIDIEGMKCIEIPYTSLSEQREIGDYLELLDHIITLHQRKCEETKKLKKYMLQKMFPQNGQTVPEIRFAGFTDAWEQRKLDDVAEFSKGSGYSKGDLIEVGTPIILYGRLYTKYETSISDVDTYVEAKEGSVYSKGGEVIVPASGETAEDIARAATVDKSGILLGGDLNVVMPSKDINSAFMAISISNGNSQRELAKKAQGKSVVHIHNEEIRNLIVPFPNKVEQDKIVDYFTSLDHLITLHQHKCEQLQNMKKFMLQNMFV